MIERNNKIILFYGIVWFFVLPLWFYLKTPASVLYHYWNYFIHLATYNCNIIIFGDFSNKIFTDLNLDIKNKNKSELQYNHTIFDISSNIFNGLKISSFNNYCPQCLIPQSMVQILQLAV